MELSFDSGITQKNSVPETEEMQSADVNLECIENCNILTTKATENLHLEVKNESSIKGVDSDLKFNVMKTASLDPSSQDILHVDSITESAKETNENILLQNHPTGIDSNITEHQPSEDLTGSAFTKATEPLDATNEMDAVNSDTNKMIAGEFDSIILPSEVDDEEEIFFPQNISNEDPTIYGKWLIFTNGNLQIQDKIWSELHNLIKQGDLTLIASSTVKQLQEHTNKNGVIKCYTLQDINIIKGSGLAIQNILKDNRILDYKTNESSRLHLYRDCKNKFIVKFMLTANGNLYKRDEWRRWIKVTKAEFESFNFDKDESAYTKYESPFAKRRLLDLGLDLPSKETKSKRKKYFYPENAKLDNWSCVWCLFCTIADADDNGLTELDRAWKEAKVLCDQKFFKSVICETLAYRSHLCDETSMRSILCEVEGSDTNRIVECADELRKRILYNMPMYYKTVNFLQRKPKFQIKFLYTEDKELYVFDERMFTLLKRY